MKSSASTTHSPSMATPPWKNAQGNRFSNTDAETDPLTGFANIMDVMLVFALGLMLALVAQSAQLQEHFNVTNEKKHVESETQVRMGKELLTVPESLKNANQAGQGMRSLGQVYKDPETGKLILVGE